MRIELFDFDLPADRIAQRPAEPRDASKLLVLDPVTGAIEDRVTADLAGLIEPGSVLVVNDTRVIPARLMGRKARTGGKVEILLVRKVHDESVVIDGVRVAAERWKAMGKASKPLKIPSHVLVGDTLVVVLDRKSERDGLLEVLLTTTDGEPLEAVVRRVGHVPLPPYIRREDDATDAARYQTVFARADGAVAAPTAGLHLTNRLLGALSERGVKVVTVTLHVGPGTFQPVQVEDLDAHQMHEEWYEVPLYTAREIDAARDRGSPVVAVGTTSVRALESSADPERPGRVRAMSGSTSLLIQPGYAFRVVDAVLTNFHLPRSTLLALVSAFAGRERVMEAYAHAVASGYRFYSYGDAMYLRRRGELGVA